MKQTVVLVFVLTALLVMSTCKQSISQINEPSNIETSTEFTDPTLTTTNIEMDFTPTIESTATPLPTATTKPDPYLFHNGSEETDLSFGSIIIDFTEGSLKGKQIKVDLRSPETLCVKKIKVGEKELCEFNSTSEALQVGNGVGLMRQENYGNLLLLVHSGYWNNEKLQAEVLRYFLEKWAKNGNTPDQQTAYVIQKLSEIEGSAGSIYIEGQKVLNVKITAAVRLENNVKDEIKKYPENVVDIVTRKNDGEYDAIGNVEAFENLKKDGHEILITFCGWGPNQETNYYRYVVLMEVEEQP